MDAFKIVRSEFNIDLKIVFCGGDSGYANYLKKYIKDQDLDNYVLFLNFVENDYLPYLYLDALVLVMPSLIGPTNIPPWEAFKMKVPTIYSSLEGIKKFTEEFISKENSLDVLINNAGAAWGGTFEIFPEIGWD